MTYTKDWRGVEIEVGQTVVGYGTQMGAFVGIVDSFTNGGNVRLKLIHKNGSRGGNEKHSIPPYRCTVVLGLPNTDLRTVHEANEESRKAEEKRKAIYATHSVREAGPYPHSAQFPLPPGVRGKPVPQNNMFYGRVHFYDYDVDAYNKAVETHRRLRNEYTSKPCANCDAGHSDLHFRTCEEVRNERRI